MQEELLPGGMGGAEGAGGSAGTGTQPVVLGSRWRRGALPPIAAPQPRSSHVCVCRAALCAGGGRSMRSAPRG